MGIKKYIFLTIVLGLLGMQKSIAQQNENSYAIFSNITETVFVHGNTTTLLTGETFYYKFYTWNTHTQSLSRISKVGYVQLIKKGGESVLSQKITLKNGMGYADFFIPTALETGSYKLVAYTRWMLNKPVSELFQMDIFVINPFQPAPANTLSNVANDSLKTTLPINRKDKNENHQILSFKKDPYAPREKVTFTLSSIAPQLEKGHYSLSVRKMDGLPEIAPINTEKFIQSLGENPTTETDDNHTNYLPEIRGRLIVGKIQNKREPGLVESKNLALSIPGKNFIFKLAKTDSTGVFRFILNEETGKENAVIQVMEDDRKNYSITLDTVNIDFSSLKFKKISLTPRLEKAIEERSIAIQIENAYHYLKKDSILPQKVPNSFFYPLATEYELENYTSFPSLAETIVEIVPQMYSIKENGDYSIHLRDYENNATKSSYGETLVLVDGLLLQDLNKFFKYDTRKIDKISLVPRGYIYGSKIFNGVVNFVTKKQDFESNLSGDYVIEKQIPGFSPHKIYFEPAYNAAKINSQIPDYRYQLLWIPEIFIENEPKEIVFYTSDVTGTFEISLEGFTLAGKPVSIEKNFIVN